MKGRTPPPIFPPVIQLAARTQAEAQAAALARQGMTGLWIVQALHDDGCKSIHSQSDADCRCSPDFILMSFEAHQNFMAFDQRMRKAGLN